VLDPEGKSIYGSPLTPGQCAAALARPALVLPVFPKPAPQAAAKPVAKK
jgi:hypothetical protein